MVRYALSFKHHSEYSKNVFLLLCRDQCLPTIQSLHNIESTLKNILTLVKHAMASRWGHVPISMPNVLFYYQKRIRNSAFFEQEKGRVGQTDVVHLNKLQEHARIEFMFDMLLLI